MREKPDVLHCRIARPQLAPGWPGAATRRKSHVADAAAESRLFASLISMTGYPLQQSDDIRQVVGRSAQGGVAGMSDQPPPRRDHGGRCRRLFAHDGGG